jgi:hypothetical protein
VQIKRELVVMDISAKIGLRHRLVILKKESRRVVINRLARSCGLAMRVLILLGLWLIAAPAAVLCEDRSDLMRVYLPYAAPEKSLTMIMDTFYLKYGIEPTVCPQTRREFFLFPADIRMFRANTGSMLAFKRDPDLKDYPHFFTKTIPVDRLVGSYWVAGNRNAAFDLSGYEGRRRYDNTALVVRQLRDVALLGTPRGEFMIDPNVIDKGELLPPSIVLLEDSRNLERLELDKSYNGPPASRQDLFLAPHAAANPGVHQITAELPQTLAEARNLVWAQQYGGITQPELVKRLREVNLRVENFTPPKASSTSKKGPKLKCSIPLPGIWEAAPEFTLGLLARKGYTKPAEIAAYVTYPVSYVDEKAQAAWEWFGFTTNSPHRWPEALEEALLEAFLNDIDHLTGGAPPAYGWMGSPSPNRQQRHSVVRGLPCLDGA